MSDNKWVMNRAGLVNFWYYSDEEYEFANGKLLLRGLNGSGKSVTMQSLITVLLDGKITANRLDPFGSRDRRMEDYLLGEKDVVDRDERTGYLYLEYKRENSDQFLTTGIGLKARRGAGLDFWGFLLTDNRRVKYDFQLVKTEFSADDGREEKIPLTRPELERQIGPQGGFVVRSQGEYAALVNKYVFGFASLDAYKDLMELLIQLRSPKLSKDFKPSVIHEILTESLPSLSDEELRPLSDTIENMEQTKQQIEDLLRDQAALTRLDRQYRDYSAVVLAEKARELFQAEIAMNKVEQLQREKTKERECKKQELAREKEQRSAFEREQEVLATQKAELEGHDVFKAEARKQALEVVIHSNKQKRQDKQTALQVKRQSEAREKTLFVDEETRLDRAETAMLEVLDELGLLAEATGFVAHQALAATFEKNYAGEFSFAQWRQEQQGHHRRVNDVLTQIHGHLSAKREQLAATQDAEKAQMAFDAVRADARRSEQAFFDRRQEVVEQLYCWIAGCKDVLPLAADVISRAACAAQQLHENTVWQGVREPVEEVYKRQEDGLRRRVALIEAEEAQQRDKRQDLVEQLAEWKTKKDPEPPRHAALTQTRRSLADAGIPFVPLYAAVEFKTGVSASERERIETVMMEIGLLDALVVPSQSLHKLPADAVDRVICPQPAILCATLADYLEPTPPEGRGVQASDVDEVLRSIIVNEAPQIGTGAAGSVTPELSVQYGTYHSGILAGRAPVRDQALYIGREARRRHRELEIARLESAIADVDALLALLAGRKQSIEGQLAELAEAFAQFPSGQSVKEAYDGWQGKLREAAIEEENANRKNELLREALNKVQGILHQLRRLAEGLPMALTEEAYEAVCQQAVEYRDGIHKLELARQSYLHSLENTKQSKQRLTELMADVDELRGECLVLDGDVKKQELELQYLLDQLAAMGAEELRRRSNAIIERLNKLPELQQAAFEKIVQLNYELKQLEEQLTGLADEAAFSAQVHACWRIVYDKEAGLWQADGWEKDAEKPTDPRAVMAKYDSAVELDRVKQLDRLTDSYYREQAVLVEYRMELADLPAEELPGVDISPDGETEAHLRRLSDLKQLSRRKRLTVEYDGRRIGPQAALALIEQHILEQQAVLSEQDRALYEEVIMNSIGRVISRRINSAEKWVAQMNDLMESLDTSSGLAFSLQWKPHTADNDDQLDTQELVGLLRADHRLLKEEDIKRVVRHFQSRIAQAKALAASKAVSFQLIVKEMLDFRQWFAFTLYYRREGMPKKELTNSVFGKFSGGEKAMAMYTPLFSAAYSRYEEAKPDAPRIISLDEAFAGVDENNIREMFDLVEKMGFNYIINSQSLWGDYDTVRRLSICELVRPKNAPFVAVVRYLWDGNARHVLYDEVL